MNLRTRLSRSNGYRELGMFDESILELEAIEFAEDRWIATTYHSGRPIGSIVPIVLLDFEGN